MYMINLSQIKKYGRWLLSLPILLSLMSCINDKESDLDNGQKTYINLTFSALNVGSGTSRATDLAEDEYEGDADERNFHTIRIWVFKSGDNGKAIAYDEIQDANRLQDKDGKITIQVGMPNTKITKSDNIDLYILANAESLLAEDGKTAIKPPSEATRSALQNLNFSICKTGLKKDEMSQEVAPEGLPMSRAVTGISINDYAVSNKNDQGKLIQIPLFRAVMKMSIFFAKPEDSEGYIKSIQLDGEQLAKNVKVFPEEETYKTTLPTRLKGAFVVGTDYWPEAQVYEYTNGNPLVGTDAIKKVVNPEDYIKGKNETATEYMNRLRKDGISSFGPIYLPETDKKSLTGVITTGSGPNNVTFTDFLPYRNHQLVIYAYFTNKTDLNLQYQVIPWEDGGGSVDFE